MKFEGAILKAFSTKEVQRASHMQCLLVKNIRMEGSVSEDEKKGTM